jgi:rRNA maturation endonuclease Nob1
MTADRLKFRLCSRCGRAVVADTQERFCINDGEPLLERRPHCRAEIHSPYAHFCARCGQLLLRVAASPESRPSSSSDDSGGTT